jgi:riboflavin synthase
MFTGIVEEVGTVVDLTRDGDAARLEIACRTVVADVALGDSIAVDGCCLTVTAATDRGFTADLMAETLRVTALGDLHAGARVNLERAMRADARFGGHLVQGHVDAVGEVVTRDDRPGTVALTVAAPAVVARYLVPKGSVTVAGVSLTVVDVHPASDGGARFGLGLIPHTLEVTTFGELQPGRRVNLEADVIAKHVEHLLTGGVPSPYTADAVPAPGQPSEEDA